MSIHLQFRFKNQHPEIALLANLVRKATSWTFIHAEITSPFGFYLYPTQFNPNPYSNWWREGYKLCGNIKPKQCDLDHIEYRPNSFIVREFKCPLCKTDKIYSFGGFKHGTPGNHTESNWLCNKGHRFDRKSTNGKFTRWGGTGLYTDKDAY